jgi:glutathione S-transferase
VSYQPPSGGLHPEIELPHTQEWELYHNTFSLCSKKLRVCLAELDLPYASHSIELIETGWYENISPGFLKVNAGATVPVLVHEGHPVYESHDQILYAAAHAGERGAELLPQDPEVQARVDHWIDCASLVGDVIGGTKQRAGSCIPGLTVPLFATMVAHIPTRKILTGLLRHPDKKRPVLFLTLKLLGVRGLVKVPPLLKLVTVSRVHMGAHLDALGRELEKRGGPWIAGESFTLADVSWVVILDRLVEVGWEDCFWGRGQRPEVAAYWERLRARPSFRQAIEDVRGDVVRRGIAEVAEARARDPQLRDALEGS